jgi:alkylated DNA repair dioxygenase AlkB
MDNSQTVYNLTDRSWLLVQQAPLTIDFDKLWRLRPTDDQIFTILGKTVVVPRKQQSYIHDYVFSGDNHASLPLPDELVEIKKWVDEALGQEFVGFDGTDKPPSTPWSGFNQVMMVWYKDGHDYIGPHSDDESQLVPGSPIASLSFGATRKFRIREKTKEKTKVIDVDLKDGMFVVMGGDFQKEFKHEIVKVNGAKGSAIGPRINITFRLFK